MKNPINVATALSRYASHTLDAGTLISDSAANIMADIDLLFPLFKAGDIGRIAVTGTAPAVIAITADQLRNEGGLLGKITGNFTFTVSGSMTAGQLMGISLPLRQHVAGGVGVTDTAANVALRLGALWTMAQLGEVKSITLTDTAMPTLAISAAQLVTEISALNLIVSPFALSVAGTLTAAQATRLAIGLLAQVTGGIAVTDSAAHVMASLGSFAAIAARGGLGAITLTDATTPTFTLTGAQFTADAAALAKIASPYSLVLTGPLTVAQLLALTPAELQAAPAAMNVTDSAANVSAHLEGLESVYSVGKLGVIALTDGGTPTLSMTGHQFESETDVLMKITTPFRIDASVQPVSELTNPYDSNSPILVFGLPGVSAANLGRIPDALFAKLTSPLTVYEDHVGADDLDRLESFVKAGKVDRILMEDQSLYGSTGRTNGASSLGITAAMLDRDIDALEVAQTTYYYREAYSNPYYYSDSQGYIDPSILTYYLTTPVTAAEAVLASTQLYQVGTMQIVDTAAHIAANYDALYGNASIASITFIDPAGTAVLPLTNAQFVGEGWKMLPLITSPYKIALSSTVGAPAVTVTPQVAPHIPTSATLIDTVTASTNQGVVPLAVSNDGRYVVLLRQSAVVLMDRLGATSTIVSASGTLTAAPGVPRELRFLAVRDTSGNLQLLDIATGTERPIATRSATITSTVGSVSPDGSHAVFWQYEPSGTSLVLEDMASGVTHVLATTVHDPLGYDPGPAVISPDGASVVYSLAGHVTRVDIATLAETVLYSGLTSYGGGNTSDAARDVTRDGHYALGYIGTTSVRIDTTTGATIAVPFAEGGRLSQDGEYVTGQEDQYDVATGAFAQLHLTTASASSYVANQTGVSLSPTVQSADGTYVAYTETSRNFAESPPSAAEYDTYVVHTAGFTPPSAQTPPSEQGTGPEVLVTTGYGQILYGSPTSSHSTYFLLGLDSVSIGPGTQTVVKGPGGYEEISFQDHLFSSARQVMAHATHVGDDTVISRAFSGTDGDITLTNFYKGDLSGDYLFADNSFHLLPEMLAPTIDFGTLGIAGGHRVWTPTLELPDQVATTVKVTGSVAATFSAPDHVASQSLPVTILSGVETINITATDTDGATSTTKVYADAASTNAPVSFLAPTGYDLNILIGAGGNDTLIGGATADYFLGNGGNDTFVMGSGKETVWDWNAATDKINLAGSGFTSLGDVLNHTSNNGTEAFITRPTGGYIDLKGGNLTSSNILLS